jgi:hypothetical protein
MHLGILLGYFVQSLCDPGAKPCPATELMFREGPGADAIELMFREGPRADAIELMIREGPRAEPYPAIELMFREDPLAEPYPATVVISGQGETFPSLPVRRFLCGLWRQLGP